MARALPWIVVLAASFGGRALADADGDKLLAQVDQALDRAPSHALEFRAVTAKEKQPERAATLAVKLAKDKWLVEFLDPPT